MVGKDLYGDMIIKELNNHNINSNLVYQLLETTPQDVVICDDENKMQRYSDFKAIEEKIYNRDIFFKAMKECSIIFLCNDDLSNDFLNLAEESENTLATSIQDIEHISSYRNGYIERANILFGKSDNLDESVENCVRRISNEYDNDIIVVSFGASGALLYVRKDNFIGRYPFVKTRKIVNTHGSDNALFAAFLHCYNKSNDPYSSLKKALCFQSYKLGGNSELEGFITDEQLEKLYNFLYN
jgi:ribokinase